MGAEATAMASDRDELPILDELREQLVARFATLEATHTASRGGGSRRGGRGGEMLVAAAAIAVVAAVVWVALGVGVRHHAANRAPVTSGVSPAELAACRAAVSGSALPPLIQTNAPPEHELLALLGLLRQPQTRSDRVNLRTLDRLPWDVVTVYRRYTRVIAGPERTLIELIPAVICLPPAAVHLGTRVRAMPESVLAMRVLGDSATHPTLVLGTVTDIRTGHAIAGAVSQSWPRSVLEVAVVPDRVARVSMTFSPHTQVTMAIHDDVGTAVVRSSQPPFRIRWYDRHGDVISPASP
jgi:hypothetical protein